MKNILMVTFLLLTSVEAEFIRDGELDVVNDTTTCLMWQDDVTSKTVTKNWQDAVDYCEDRFFAGYDDWRLPNNNELYSIADRARFKPAIKPIFLNIASKPYWSSTVGAGPTLNVAWGVSFYEGENFTRTMGALRGYVRCVRDGGE